VPLEPPLDEARGVLGVAVLLEEPPAAPEYAGAVGDKALLQDALVELGVHVAGEDVELGLAEVGDAGPDVKLRRVFDGRQRVDLIGPFCPHVLVVSFGGRPERAPSCGLSRRYQRSTKLRL